MLSSSSGGSSVGGWTTPNTNTSSSSVPIDPLKYVNEMTSRASVNLDSLLQARKTVALYAEETNTQLKRNVYKNYQLFIDTSKEISYLKKEMSQLAKLLNDEHRLLDALLAISIGGGGNSKALGSSGGGSSSGSASANSSSRGGELKKVDNSSRDAQNNSTEEDAEADAQAWPYWLTELPDDLDVYIAQRNFEEAVKLVANANNHFYMYPKYGNGGQGTSSSQQAFTTDLRARIDAKIAELVDVLSAELNVAPDRSLQTGPRASRRAVALLVRLGKSALAIRLFLDQRSKLLKHRRAQKPATDGATLPYMRRMTALFFSHIVETSKEFLRAFEIDAGALLRTVDAYETPNNTENNRWTSNNNSYYNSPNSRRNSDDGFLGGTAEQGNSPNATGQSSTTSTPSSSAAPFSHSVLACLNTWTYQQLQAYLELLAKHVFIPAVPKETRNECVALALHHCAKLKHAIGVDLSFVVQRELQKPVYQMF